MRALLQEIIDAGQGAELPLDMTTWHCGSACCLCGDVALARNPKANAGEWEAMASSFASDLYAASRKLFGKGGVAGSVYKPIGSIRRFCAKESGLFTRTELKHPHLTTNHHDRAIAHDWIRIVMSKLPEGDHD
jgi:hypothetical protein